MDTETSRVGKLLADQAEEIVKLKKQNAELVRAFDKVKTITDVHDDTQVLAALNKIAQAAIAKATGGE